MANILVVYAHPEPRSLNGSLKQVIVRALESAGHQIKITDLYGMRWKSEIDAEDFGNLSDGERMHITSASRAAFEGGKQSPDVVAEQEKLLWADAVVFQFPLWWSAPPAIFKGWVDRVFANGFGYGIGSYEGPQRARRYGDGTLVGKRALVSITGGGHSHHYSPRGIKGGTISEVLWPLMHGLLWYTGMEVLPPVTLLSAERVSESQFAEHASLLRARLATIMTAPAIPYRYGNSGDYDDNLQLKPNAEAHSTGLAIHLRQEPDTSAS